MSRNLQGNAFLSTCNDRIGIYHFLHRFLGGDPRSACQGKTVGDMNTQIDIQGISYLEYGVHAFPPGLRQLSCIAVVLRTIRNILDWHQVRTGNASLLHSFQVSPYSLVRYTTVHPVPESPWLVVFCGLLEVPDPRWLCLHG